MANVKEMLEAMRLGVRYDLANREYICAALGRAYTRMLAEAGLTAKDVSVRFTLTDSKGRPQLHLIVVWTGPMPTVDKMAICRVSELRLMEKYVPAGLDVRRSNTCTDDQEAAGQA